VQLDIFVVFTAAPNIFIFFLNTFDFFPTKPDDHGHSQMSRRFSQSLPDCSGSLIWDDPGSHPGINEKVEE